jgi:hypothetical protein
MRKVSCDLTDRDGYAESFGLSTLSKDNMRKVSCDLAGADRHAESIGLPIFKGNTRKLSL